MGRRIRTRKVGIKKKVMKGGTWEQGIADFERAQREDDDQWEKEEKDAEEKERKAKEAAGRLRAKREDDLERSRVDEIQRNYNLNSQEEWVGKSSKFETPAGTARGEEVALLIDDVWEDISRTERGAAPAKMKKRRKGPTKKAPKKKAPKKRAPKKRAPTKKAPKKKKATKKIAPKKKATKRRGTPVKRAQRKRKGASKEWRAGAVERNIYPEQFQV